MKIQLTALFTLLLMYTGTSQNTNMKSEVKTVTTTIKDSKGEKVIVKSQESNEVQKIALENEKPNTLNIPIKESPVSVTTKTKITVDGITKTIDVNHSAYYSMGGMKYQIVSDNTGYEMMNSNNLSSGVLRKTSNNNYIFKNKNSFSVGYFDGEGNLILETYNEKEDSIIQEKYSIIKP
jgi:hypothetical protein